MRDSSASPSGAPTLKPPTRGARSADTPGRRRSPTNRTPSWHLGDIRTYQRGHRLADKYVLLQLLGEGGMGSVWLAVNEALGSQVAIKLVHGKLPAGDGAERLLQEARATASLQHPSIVRVFDIGHSGPERHPFIVMEAVKGESLAAVLDRVGHVHPLKAAQLVIHLTSALDTAHGAGIIHRDIKPENVILEEVGKERVVPKLVDFGIARILGAPDRRLTVEGLAMGSPEYQSPEQAKALRDVDGRADIWALCLMLYELVAGERPFDGATAAATARNVVGMTPKTFAELGVDEPELWSIVARGLDKDLERRWPTMLDLSEALLAWAQRRGLPAPEAQAPLEIDWYSEYAVEVLESHRPARREGSKTQTLGRKASETVDYQARSGLPLRGPASPEPEPAGSVRAATRQRVGTVRMSTPELEQAAAHDARDDEELPSRVREAAPQAKGPMTALAGRGFTLASAFNAALREPFTGWQVELATPVGPSTGGGAQPLQHISLQGPEGHRLAIGHVDASKLACTLRSHGMVDVLHRERYGAPFSVSETEYKVFVAKLENLLRSFELRLVVEVVAALPPERAKLTRPNRRLQAAIGVVVLLLILLAVAISI